MDTTTLDMLKFGESGTVTALCATDGMRRRLLDIGFTNGAFVTCVGQSPLGDPIAFYIRGATIALRKNDCRTVHIQPCNGGEQNGTY